MKTRFFYFDEGKYGMGEEDVPAVQQDQVLLKTVRSLVSVGTETSCNTGRARWKKGRHGYSAVARVIEVGAEVREFGVGDRVVSPGLMHMDYAVAGAGSGLYRIPEGVPDEAATFATLGAVALHLIERSAITFGRTVVVIGQGSVGQLVHQLAHLAGAGTVIAVDVDADRRALSRRLGADEAIPPTREALVEVLGRVVPGTAAPVLIEVSGTAAGIEWAVGVAPLRSRIVLAGNYLQDVSINPLSIVEREIDLVGAHQPKCPQDPSHFYPYNRRFNYGFILDRIRSGAVRVKELYDELIRPEQLIGFYDAVRDGRPRPRQPIIQWE